MKRPVWMVGICLILLGGWTLPPSMARAEVELTPLMQLSLKAPPLDVSSSADGEWLFVLVPGELMVYSMPEERWVSRMEVDAAFDRVTYSERTHAVILTSGAEQALKMVQLAVIHEIAVSGLPFKGPAEAAVTVAVFSDYQ